MSPSHSPHILSLLSFSHLTLELSFISSQLPGLFPFFLTWVTCFWLEMSTWWGLLEIQSYHDPVLFWFTRNVNLVGFNGWFCLICEFGGSNYLLFVGLMRFFFLKHLLFVIIASKILHPWMWYYVLLGRVWLLITRIRTWWELGSVLLA